MAYTSNKTSLVLLIATLVAVVGLIGYGPTTAQAACVKPDFNVLIADCSPYLGNPTAAKARSACCKFLRGLDIACACSYMPKDMVSFIGPAIALARHCGVTIQSGTKCGSYTVPQV